MHIREIRLNYMKESFLFSSDRIEFHFMCKCSRQPGKPVIPAFCGHLCLWPARPTPLKKKNVSPFIQEGNGMDICNAFCFLFLMNLNAIRQAPFLRYNTLFPCLLKEDGESLEDIWTILIVFLSFTLFCRNPEQMKIRRSQVRRIWWVLGEFPHFNSKLLQGPFCNMRSCIVVVENDKICRFIFS